MKVIDIFEKMLLVILLLTGAKNVAAQHVIISTLNGAELQAALDLVGRLEVSDGKLRLVSTEGEVLGETSIAAGCKIDFSGDVPSGVNKISEDNAKVRIKCDNVVIESIPNSTTLRIYTIEGKLIHSWLLKPSADTQQISLSDLTAGIYLLQVNTQIFKIIKR